MARSGRFIENFGYCANLVKSHNFEGFITASFLNKSHYILAISLNAYAVEASLFVEKNYKLDKFTQTHAEFWTQSLDDFVKEKKVLPKQPTVCVIGEIVKKFNVKPIVVDQIKQMFLKRLYLLKPIPFHSMEDAIDYANVAFGNYYRVMVSLTGMGSYIDNSVVIDDFIRNTSTLLFLCNMIRSVCLYMKNKKCIIPMELFLKYELSHDQFFTNPCSSQAKALVHDIHTIALKSYAYCLKHIGEFTKYDQRLFVLVPISKTILSRISKCEYNFTDPTIQKTTLYSLIIPYLHSKIPFYKTLF